MNLSPICLFTYNRFSETQQTVEALQKNYLAFQSELIIFSDGAKDIEGVDTVNKVRQYLRTIKGFKSIKIYESSKNKGLAQSIITGVTQIVKQYGKVIVLEDDLVTCPNFLNFMNDALNYYENNLKIQSINGYSLKINSLIKDSDVYFHKRTFPWGWATWGNRWDYDIFNKEKIKLMLKNDRRIVRQFQNKCGDDISKMLISSIEGKNNSWYVRWVFSHYINDCYSVFPKYSKISNIGFNLNGTHCQRINSYKSIPDIHLKKQFKFIDLKMDEKVNKDFLKYFKFSYKLSYRLSLLKNSIGRSFLIDEIKLRLNKYK